MSATIHAAPFVNFFGGKEWQTWRSVSIGSSGSSYGTSHSKGDGSGIFEPGGETHPSSWTAACRVSWQKKLNKL